MKEKWYWIELIGFDKDCKDFKVSEFLQKINHDIVGVNILFSSVDFVNCHKGMSVEYMLTEGDCSYGGHEYNEERRIQLWTNYELRALVTELHKYGLKVLFSFFNFCFYRKLDGTTGSQGFADENLNIKERVFDGEYRECVCPIKRLKDGTYYDEYLVKKVWEIVSDYGFDGVVYADGISSLRHPIQMADYSDDLVEQFITRTRVSLPSYISLKCDDNVSEYAVRRKYIFENLQYEWLRFIAERFKEFYGKQLRKFEGTGKIFMFNSVWTKSVFEAFLRYGLDYTDFDDERIYAVMSEDCGSIQPVYSDFDQGGIYIPFFHRRYINNHFETTQMEMKVAMPSIKHISMCTLKDNAEQWNVVDDMPGEFRKATIRRCLATWADGSGVLQRTSNGPMYCLSDGIKKETWEKISATEAVEQELAGMEKQGFVFISNKDVSGEIKDYIYERKWSSNKILNELYDRKIAVAGAADKASVNGIKNPLIFANVRFFDKKYVEDIEKIEDKPYIIFDYDNPLSVEPDYILSYGDETGVKMYVYNFVFVGTVRRRETVDRDFKAKVPSYYHKFDNIWTYRLEYESVSEKFWKKAVKIIKEVQNSTLHLPEQTARCDVNINVFKKGNRYALFIQNNDYYIASTKILFSCKIKNCQMLSKPFWYEILHGDFSLCPKIPARGAEIVMVETE